jgi:D-beta-D-heptose 7-phosphate kinase/D-beta-D-heptose 1-phosphate adenosyltransferase
VSGVVVVGDTLLDVDVIGTATRLSPDGPVPVVDVSSRSRRAGGAGLVAAMLALDGVEVTLVTALADDGGADELRAALGDVPVVAGPLGAGTPTKTRVRAEGGHAITRVDDHCGPVAPPTVTDEMLETVLDADAIVVADYGRGITAVEPLRDALRTAARRGVPVVWDPHPRGARPVPGCTVVTPNQGEAQALHRGEVDDVASAGVAGAALRRHWDVTSVAVTLGSRGAVLVTHDSAAVAAHVPAPVIGPVDPCGAGDRLASALAVALIEGLPLDEALGRAVHAAAAFLAAGGVAALDLAALGRRGQRRADAAPPEPVALPGADALAVARRVAASGGTVVATGGCFDLLHAGHARTLAAARALGDCLVVCLNSDASVSRLKGPERPIMSQGDRVDLLLALECVDAVVVFDEDTPHAVLDRLRPDVWVKGGDYSAETLPEASLVAGWGGRTVTVPFHPGRSTTRLASALARVG